MEDEQNQAKGIGEIIIELLDGRKADPKGI